MDQQDINRIQKVASLILADTGEAGYYAEVEDADPYTASIRLRLIDGYFSRSPSPAEIKPVAQALRSGLIKRGYQVKGTKPTVIRDNTVYFYNVRKSS